MPRMEKNRLNVLAFIIWLLANFIPSTSAVQVSNSRAVFTQKPRTTVAVVGSQNPSVTFRCTAVDGSGLALKTLLFREVTNDKNGGTIDDRRNDPWVGRKQFVGKHDGDGFSLTFDRVDPWDAGIYRCAVLVLSPYPGVLLSEGARLTVAEPMNENAIFSEPLHIAMGSVLRLKCPLSDSSISVIWHHYAKRVLPYANPRLKTPASGQLYVFNADESDCGIYTCSNERGQIFQSFNVTKFAEFNVTSPNEILFAPMNISVTAGGIAFFECIFPDYNATKKISWKRLDNGPMPKTAEKSHGIFTINDVNLSHQGWYVCHGGKYNAEHATALKAFLTVQYAPKISKFSDEQTKKRYEMATFSCKAKGRPPPNIVWYKNGELVKAHGHIQLFPPAHMPPNILHASDAKFDSNLNFRPNSHASFTINATRENLHEADAIRFDAENEFQRDLVVSSVQPEDGGVYQCFAVNNLGETSAASLLICRDDGATEAPHNLTAMALQRHEKFQLSWKISQSLINKKITVFILHFHSNDDGEVENTEPVTFKEACPGNGPECSILCCGISAILKPRTNYTFWLTALFESGTFSQPSNRISALSWEQACFTSVPLFLREAGDFSGLIFNWDELPFGLCPGTVLEYRLEKHDVTFGSMTNEFLSPDQRQLIVKGLNQASVYKFRLIPKTRAGYPEKINFKDRSFTWITYETLDSVQNKLGDFLAPFLKIDKIYVNSILVTWLTDNVDGTLTVPGGFTVKIRQWRIEVADCKSLNGQPLSSYLADYSDRSMKIQGLEPSTCYRVRLYFYATFADGPGTVKIYRGPSSILNVVTASRPIALQAATFVSAPPTPSGLACEPLGPSAPLSLRLKWSPTTSVTPSASSLQYDRPSVHYAGSLQYAAMLQYYGNKRYVVRYGPASSGNDRSAANSSDIKMFETVDTFAVISHLAYGQSYVFAVRVESDTGGSKFSDDIFCTLLHPTPLPPREVAYTMLNDESLFLTWEPPRNFSNGENFVKSYRVHLIAELNANGKEPGRIINSTTRFAYLNALHRNTTYRITVAALNPMGVPGPPSDPITVLPTDKQLANQQFHNDKTDAGHKVIVVERKSYVEGVLIGVCFAIVCLLVLLIMKFGGAGVTDFCATRGCSCRHAFRRVHNRNCTACDATHKFSGGCAAVHAHTLPSCSLLHCENMELAVDPWVENSTSDSKGVVKIPHISKVLEQRSIVKDQFKKRMTQPLSLNLEASHVTGPSSPNACESSGRPSSICYRNPWRCKRQKMIGNQPASHQNCVSPTSTNNNRACTTSDCAKNCKNGDHANNNYNSRFCSAPNLLTDSGIGFDECHFYDPNWCDCTNGGSFGSHREIDLSSRSLYARSLQQPHTSRSTRKLDASSSGYALLETDSSKCRRSSEEGAPTAHGATALNGRHSYERLNRAADVSSLDRGSFSDLRGEGDLCRGKIGRQFKSAVGICSNKSANGFLSGTKKISLQRCASSNETIK